MNELALQAKELAEQSFREDNAKRFTVMEKFAELIVQECAAWMENEQDEKGDRIGDSFYWADRMRLHFGVEE
jgi:hypothetical protein